MSQMISNGLEHEGGDQETHSIKYFIVQNQYLVLHLEMDWGSVQMLIHRCNAYLGGQHQADGQMYSTSDEISKQFSDAALIFQV